MDKVNVQEQQPFDLAWRTIEGLNIRYATAGTSDETVILLSPWPESIFAFASVWDGLTRRFKVLAIDLPGFGQSEGRDDLFAPRQMGEFITKAIDAFGSRRYTPSDLTSERRRCSSPRWRVQNSSAVSSWVPAPRRIHSSPKATSSQ
jgi:hypothetical protein